MLVTYSCGRGGPFSNHVGVFFRSVSVHVGVEELFLCHRGHVRVIEKTFRTVGGTCGDHREAIFESTPPNLQVIGCSSFDSLGITSNIQWSFLNHRRGSCRNIGGCVTGNQEAIVRSSRIHIRLIGGHIRIKGVHFLMDGVWCMLQVGYCEMHDGS